MGIEADTDKPHSHHAIAKDVPEDKNSKQVPKQDELRNKAAPGVCLHLNSMSLPS